FVRGKPDSLRPLVANAMVPSSIDRKQLPTGDGRAPGASTAPARGGPREGAEAMHSPILAPVVALILWSFVMWAWLYATRIPAMAKNKIVYDPTGRMRRFMCS